MDPAKQIKRNMVFSSKSLLFNKKIFISVALDFSVLEEDGVAFAVLPREEDIRRLRDRNEPILLFAETEIEAFRRLRKLEISEPEINRVSQHLSSNN